MLTARRRVWEWATGRPAGDAAKNSPPRPRSIAADGGEFGGEVAAVSGRAGADSYVDNTCAKTGLKPVEVS